MSAVAVPLPTKSCGLSAVATAWYGVTVERDVPDDRVVPAAELRERPRDGRAAEGCGVLVVGERGTGEHDRRARTPPVRVPPPSPSGGWPRALSFRSVRRGSAGSGVDAGSRRYEVSGPRAPTARRIRAGRIGDVTTRRVQERVHDGFTGPCVVSPSYPPPSLRVRQCDNVLRLRTVATLRLRCRPRTRSMSARFDVFTPLRDRARGPLTPLAAPYQLRTDPQRITVKITRSSTCDCVWRGLRGSVRICRVWALCVAHGERPGPGSGSRLVRAGSGGCPVRGSRRPRSRRRRSDRPRPCGRHHRRRRAWRRGSGGGSPRRPRR